MKKSQFVILITICIVILAGLIAVCLNPKEWIGCHIPELALRIVDSHGSSPVFDFTTKVSYPILGTFSQNDYYMHRFQVFRLDKNGTQVKTCWETEAPRGVSEGLKLVEYGKVPTGWKEIIPAETLQSDGIYSMTGGIVFLKTKDGYIILPGHYHYPDRIASQLQKMGITQPLATAH